jgi:hypothetical protein
MSVGFAIEESLKSNKTVKVKYIKWKFLLENLI